MLAKEAAQVERLVSVPSKMRNAHTAVHVSTDVPQRVSEGVLMSLSPAGGGPRKEENARSENEPRTSGSEAARRGVA